MEIEHSVDDSTQIRYGLFRWRERDDERYRQIFPEGEFSMDFLGERVPKKLKVDWEKHRVYVGLGKKMKENLDRKDILVISKSSDGAVVIRKKGVGLSLKGKDTVDLPLVTELRQAQRNSEDPALFEKALVETFNSLGFSAKHIGGRDEPDIFINDRFNIILDSKTTKEGVISERYINFDAMDRYKESEKYRAKYIGVVAPGFSEGYIRETAKKRGIILIETESICKILQNHKTYPYEPNRIVQVLFESGKSIVTPDDIPPSTIDQEKLIKIVAKILSDIKLTRKTSCTSCELHIAYSWQVPKYEVDEIEKALEFLSTAPLSILRKQDKIYSLTGDIESILKQIGLLLEAFNKIGR